MYATLLPLTESLPEFCRNRNYILVDFALFCRKFAIDSGKRFGAGIYRNQWAINEKPAVARVWVGAERGNRTPTMFPPADFESAASTDSAISAWDHGE
jgi:hypothetical protein